MTRDEIPTNPHLSAGEINMPTGTSSGQVLVDPENPEGYMLTITRKKKIHRGCFTWKLLVNGMEIGKIANGASISVSGNVGDTLEVFIGTGCKTKVNTYEMVVKSPGHLSLKLKQVGDLTFYIWILAVLCLAAMQLGIHIAVIPFLMFACVGIPSIYEYCKAGWREIAACKTGNSDLEKGSIVHVTTRGFCG